MRTTVFAALLGLCMTAPCALATPVPYTNKTPGASTFVVSQTGLYQLTAIGAEGGASRTGTGGLGASITGDFFLTTGDVLSLLVGGVGGSDRDGGGGGGGGTFVMFGSTPFVVAGGGGGGNTNGSGFNASLTTSGRSSDGVGGTAGNGGGGTGSGASGGGLLTNGGNGFATTGGMAYVNGGAGGSGGGCCGADGGIGGGGGANNYGGGGGGYSGGGGGNAGGGGSYNGGLADLSLADHVLTAAVNGGNGEVIIALLQAAATVPEPGSMFVFAIGGVALIASRRRRARGPSRG